MAISACKVVSAFGLDRLNNQIAVAVADGFAPHGDLLPVANGEFVLIMVKRDAGIQGCKVIEAAGLVRLNDALAAQVVAGFVPHSDILTLPESYALVLVKGDAGSGGGGTVTVDGITDASTVGKNVLKAADAAAGRAAIGAGVGNSNLVVGTLATQAKAGNYQPTAANISDAGTFGRQLLQAPDQAAAKTLLGIA